MDDLDTQRKLAEAKEAVVAQHQRPSSPPAAKPRRGLPQRAALLALVVVWAGLGWVWVAQPAAIFGPGAPRIPTESERDALARHALYLQRARIEQFRAERGRLPRELSETGEVEEGVTYVPTPPDFVVMVPAFPGKGLELTNQMDADSFLGDALGRLPRPVVQ